MVGRGEGWGGLEGSVGEIGGESGGEWWGRWVCGGEDGHVDGEGWVDGGGKANH